MDLASGEVCYPANIKPQVQENRSSNCVHLFLLCGMFKDIACTQVFWVPVDFVWSPAGLTSRLWPLIVCLFGTVLLEVVMWWKSLETWCWLWTRVVFATSTRRNALNHSHVIGWSDTGMYIENVYFLQTPSKASLRIWNPVTSKVPLQSKYSCLQHLPTFPAVLKSGFSLSRCDFQEVAVISTQTGGSTCEN